MISSAPGIHHPPHNYDNDVPYIYTAAFMRTTTITYILQRFTTTIVPVIHYYAYAEKRVSNSKRKEKNCKIMMRFRKGRR